MPVELRCEVAILCEGDADKAFFDELFKNRSGFPPIDVVPVRGNDFKHQLEALRGNPHGFARLKGVLIVADSGDRPERTFRQIRAQIRAADGYPHPAGLLQIAPRTVDHPAVSVMLLPDDSTPGGLETLFVRELVARNGWIVPCVDAFFRCGQITAHGWPPEKADKARFQCIVAVLNKKDPTRAASKVFEWSPPVVHIQADCFDDVEQRIRAFCTAVGA